MNRTMTNSEFANKVAVTILIGLMIVVFSHGCDLSHEETMKRIETKCEAIK